MAEEARPSESSAAPKPGFWRRWLTRTATALAILIALGASLIGVAEHETSQPEFCGSCHIMEPYYASWHEDIHGAKLDVACVDCHYAPGERTTVKAKLRGLSQVASYFSGRYGATRPRAHVSNLSCMTAKCHGDGDFMDKEISIGTVTFTHAKHLQNGEEEQKALQEKLSQVEDALRNVLGNEERFEQLIAVTRLSGPANERIDEMAELVEQWDVAVDRQELVNFSQLNHRQVRLAQLADIQCTNCHSYSAPISLEGEADEPGHHFTVTTTSCFTCHFNNEGFNTGTNTCLMCHTLPTQEILVHEELSQEESEKLESPELAEMQVKMDHQMILDRKVSCIACHADVASEDSLVTRRNCQRCHDQPRYFEDWQQPFTLDVVARYHKIHVPYQRAKCLDCHSEIHHQLARKEEGRPGFLASAMANCTQCHPNQHAEQLALLSGKGGIGVPQSAPNLMFGARTNCYGCHLDAALDKHGGETYKGSLGGCIACHGDRHSETFEKWKLGLEITQMDAEEAYANARKMLEEATDAPEDARHEAAELLAAAQADLRLVKQGNGLHNVTYAMELYDSVTRRSQQAMEALSQEPSAR